jgi:hypothetical protein
MQYSTIKEIFNMYYNGEKNFMTPKVYGYSYKKFGDEILLFEKSEGEGISGEPLYGASALVYNTVTNEVQKIDLSQPKHSRADIEAHIKSITREQFQQADRYGEIKIY